MDLIEQIQGIGYSFVYGIVFTFVYHFIYSYLIKIKVSFMRYSWQIIIGIVFAGIYFYGLLLINEGVIRLYFLVSVIAGYVVYQNMMNQVMINWIVFLHRIFYWLFYPVYFVFLKINVIIGNMKKVVKWQRED